MALKPATAAAKFENPDEDGDVAVAEAPAEAKPAEASKPATQTAVAVKPAGGALAKATINLADADVFGALQNRLPPAEFGEGINLVGSNGMIMDRDKRKLGSFVTLLLLSWNERYVISPGKDGKEAAKLARYSLDKVYTTKGESVEEYLAELKKEGYKDAALKTYVDLTGILESAEKPDAVNYIGDTVVVSLAPDSVRTMNGFRRDLTIKAVTGKLQLPADSLGLSVRISTDIKSANGNDWTRLILSLV